MPKKIQNKSIKRHPPLLDYSSPFFPRLQPALLPEPATRDALGMRRKLRNAFFRSEKVCIEQERRRQRRLYRF